jgi:hypothetical protein
MTQLVKCTTKKAEQEEEAYITCERGRSRWQADPPAQAAPARAAELRPRPYADDHAKRRIDPLDKSIVAAQHRMRGWRQLGLGDGFTERRIVAAGQDRTQKGRRREGRND